MSSSWKLQASSLALFAAASVAALFGMPRGAEAAGCPTTPVAERGGMHWCYKHDNAKGNVHLWTPPGYKADTAITVVYIHGLDTGKNGPDRCLNKRPYVDCIWDASDHDIVGQFAASGVNALFVAVEGRVGPESIKWASLGSLMTSISEKGKVAPPSSVTLAGHSAGMYTARALWSDARVTHVISLDWVDGPLEGQVSSWYKQGGARKLTLIGGSGGQQTIMNRMSIDLPCQRASSPSNLSSSEVSVRCLYMRTGVGHMRVVFEKTFLPQAILRSSTVAAGGAGGTTGGAPTGGAGGSIVTQSVSDATLDAPTLEIPIPGLEFSDAIRTDGQVTIPWLAQYIGGVYTFLLSIAGLLAAVMMMVGGFQYVTAGGDKGRLGAGRQKIVNALTGLVLALGSYVILYAINPNLVAFDGLKVGSVNPELFLEEDHDPSLDLVSSSTGESPGPTQISDLGFADSAKAFCGSKATCDVWCRQHSDPSTWPKTTPGYMPIEQTVVIADYKLSDAFPGRTPDRVIVRGNGQRAHPKVRDALYAAAKQAVTDYPGKAYAIRVGECWRSIERQIRGACAGSPGSFTGAVQDVGSAVAYPGGSNHGVGYACDLKLYDGERNMIPTTRPATRTQCTKVTREDSKRFDDIMFKVGWVRYAAEVWHYEFGSPSAGRCGPNAKHGGPAECVFPPKRFCS